MKYNQIFLDHHIKDLQGRYISLCNIEPYFQKWNAGNLDVAGRSIGGRPVYRFTIGNGKIRVFIWSQMHGNESTTTKALMDFLSLLHSGSGIASNLLAEFTFCCLPMVNPDGAEKYTRENANGVDLNRDACNLTQPESLALRSTFEDFKPDFCYNLHDQRTIYSAGNIARPATVSFLAPAFNELREMNPHRLKAVNLICAMNDVLQKYIPGQVGRYDDAYNPNCIGDTLQAMDVPTVLFEAGHYPADYNREITRKFIFIAILSGFEALSENVIVPNRFEDYMQIPQNETRFYDFVYRNVSINYEGKDLITSFAAQFKEILSNGKIEFEAEIARLGEMDIFFGHSEFDAQGSIFRENGTNVPELMQRADFFLGDIEVKNGKIVN